MTSMRRKTGLTEDFYHWLLSHPTAISLANQAAAAAKDTGIVVVVDRDGKHASVAIAEAAKLLLKSDGLLTTIQHVSLDGRPQDWEHTRSLFLACPP